MGGEKLRIDNLSIGYRDHRRGAKVVATGISGELHAGELVCLIGSNGVGKSTLLRTICGLQRPLEGSVTIDGADVSAMSRRDMATKVSIVLTSVERSLALRASEVVGLGRSPYTG